MSGHFFRSKILISAVIVLFSLMLVAEGVPITPDESLFSRLITQGKEFYENAEFERAAAKYQSAQAVAENNDELAEASFLLALTYHALVDMESCKSSLEKYFSVSVPSADPLAGNSYPPGFVKLFQSQKREYLEKMAGAAVPVVQARKSEVQPAVKEQEAAAPVVKKKKKKFPWLLVIAGAVVVGAVIYYFTVASKKYTLTVDMGEGVSGTPGSGAAKYKKGSTVSYNYALASGYMNLEVTLDGVVVAASGTVKMDGNHTLRARATKSYVLAVTKGAGVSGTPATGTYTYASGTTVNYNYTAASGYTNLVVKLDGVAVATSGTITMDANHTLTAGVSKSYTLTVTRGTGVNGTPATGTYTYASGTTVNYSYTAASGYSGLSVKLDNVAVTASGTITMNANHTLTVEVSKTFTLTVTRGTGAHGTPATGTYTYASGTTVNYNYTAVSGNTDLVVKLDNVEVAASGTITMNDNHQLEADEYLTLEVTDYSNLGSCTLDNHHIGTPECGTYKVKKGTTIHYNIKVEQDNEDWINYVFIRLGDYPAIMPNPIDCPTGELIDQGVADEYLTGSFVLYDNQTLLTIASQY